MIKHNNKIYKETNEHLETLNKIIEIKNKGLANLTNDDRRDLLLETSTVVDGETQRAAVNNIMMENGKEEVGAIVPISPSSFLTVKNALNMGYHGSTVIATLAQIADIPLPVSESSTPVNLSDFPELNVRDNVRPKMITTSLIPADKVEIQRVDGSKEMMDPNDACKDISKNLESQAEDSKKKLDNFLSQPLTPGKFLLLGSSALLLGLLWKNSDLVKHTLSTVPVSLSSMNSGISSSAVNSTYTVVKQGIFSTNITTLTGEAAVQSSKNLNSSSYSILLN